MKIKRVKNKLLLDGDLISENAEATKELLLAEIDHISNAKTVTIDLSKVTEIDSSGFQLLLSFIKTLESLEIGFKIKKIGEELFELVKIAGLNKYFKIQSADVIES